jgi:hypothetical protein
MGARDLDPILSIEYTTDPMWYKFPSLSPYNAMGNNPIMFIDPDGRTITLAKGFATSAFWKIYSNLIKNNSAFNVVLQKYKNTTMFNVLFKTSSTQRGGLTDITKRVWPGHSPESADATTTFPNTRDVDVANNIQYSEIGMVVVVAHEAIHLLIGSKDDRNEDNEHNLFNAYFKALTDILAEYNTDNSLGLSDNQIFELALAGQESPSGQQSPLKLKNYIKSLATKNNTTYEIEKKEYNKRIYNLIYEKLPDAKIE